MIKIGLCGKMRAGKDTAADILQKKIEADGFKVIRLAFADPLKRIAGMVQKQLQLPEEKDRELLQMLGQWARSKDGNIWVKQIERVLDSEYMQNTAVIVTDVRFPNECASLKARGFTVLRIEARECLRIARGAEESRINDVSETSTESIDVDLVVKNNTTTHDFEEDLEEALSLAWHNTRNEVINA